MNPTAETAFYFGSNEMQSPSVSSVFVVGTPGMATWAQAMLEAIAAGFAAVGARVFLFNYDNPDDQSRFEAARAVFDRQEAPYLLFDINANFNLSLPNASKHMRRFSWIIDHPARHLPKLVDHAVPPICGYVDATFIADHAALRPDLPAVFLPHAGHFPDATFRPMAKRSIDILFVGNIPPSVTEAGFRAVLAAVPDPWPTIAMEVVELVLSGTRTPWRALRERAAVDGIDITAPGMRDVAGRTLPMIENRIVALQRWVLLERLKDFRVHMAGVVPNFGGLDEAISNMPGLVSLGLQQHAAVEALVRDSRIALNPSFLLPGGFHERIWQAIGAGAVVLSTTSSVLAEVFRDGDSIAFMPPDAPTFRARVEDLLAAPERLDAMAAQARTILEQGHTYVHRAAAVLGHWEALAE